MQNIGDVIREFLKQQYSTTAECARRIGCGKSNLYDKYKRGTVYVSDLEKIADAYGYEVEIKFRKKK